MGRENDMHSMLTPYAEICGFLDQRLIPDLATAAAAVKPNSGIMGSVWPIMDECRAMALGALPGEIGA